MVKKFLPLYFYRNNSENLRKFFEIFQYCQIDIWGFLKKAFNIYHGAAGSLCSRGRVLLSEERLEAGCTPGANVATHTHIEKKPRHRCSPVWPIRQKEELAGFIEDKPGDVPQFDIFRIL